MKKLNILITGGAGFIGTHLYNQLKDRHNVKRIDNFKTSRRSDDTSDVIDMNLAFMSKNDIQKIESLLQSVDVVYHFASSIGVDLVENDPGGTLINSMNINNNLFPLFEKAQCKVIYASTSEVYGSRDTPMNEEDDLIISSPNNMRGSYACQKLMSEFLIKSYNFDYTIVRFFNVVGPGQLGNYGMVVPRFIDQALNHEELELFGDGKQVRTYCDIRDAVNVLELLLTDMNNEILNIGSNNIHTTGELAEKIVSITGTTSPIVFYDPRKNEIQYRVPDISKMKSIYEPKYTLDDIIRSMI